MKPLTFNDRSHFVANDAPRIVIFAGNNGSAHATLNRAIPEFIDQGIEPVVFLTPGSNSKKALLPNIQDFAFYETGLLTSVYDFLDNSHPLLEDGHPRRELCYSIDQLRQFYGVHIEEIKDVNEEALTGDIAADDRVLGSISLKNYGLFYQPAIDTLRDNGKFLWNVHTGPLPEYRGVFIPLRVMLEGEKKYGWTLHEIVKGAEFENAIDEGDIIDRKTIQLKASDTVHDAYFNMAGRGASMIVDEVTHIASGFSRNLKQQRESAVRYFPFPEAQHFEELAQKNKKLYDERAVLARFSFMFSSPATDPEHAQNLAIAIRTRIDQHKAGNSEFTPQPLLYLPNGDKTGQQTDIITKGMEAE